MPKIEYSSANVLGRCIYAVMLQLKEKQEQAEETRQRS